MALRKLHFSIDFRSGVPIYLQIIDQVRQMIETGELQQGDQLPPLRELAEELGVNFNTVARAYRLLDEAGILSTQHGRGTYLWEQPSNESLRNLRQQGLAGLTQSYLAEARRRRYSPEEVKGTFLEQLARWMSDDGPNTSPDE